MALLYVALSEFSHPFAWGIGSALLGISLTSRSVAYSSGVVGHDAGLQEVGVLDDDINGWMLFRTLFLIYGVFQVSENLNVLGDVREDSCSKPSRMYILVCFGFSTMAMITFIVGSAILVFASMVPVGQDLIDSIWWVLLLFVTTQYNFGLRIKERSSLWHIPLIALSGYIGTAAGGNYDKGFVPLPFTQAWDGLPSGTNLAIFATIFNKLSMEISEHVVDFEKDKIAGVVTSVHRNGGKRVMLLVCIASILSAMTCTLLLTGEVLWYRPHFHAMVFCIYSMRLILLLTAFRRNGFSSPDTEWELGHACPILTAASISSSHKVDGLCLGVALLYSFLATASFSNLEDDMSKWVRYSEKAALSLEQNRTVGTCSTKLET